MAEGTVARVDTQWNELALDHGPLESLGMPALKMVFDVEDPALPEGVREGTSLRIVADRVNGKSTVTELEVQ